MKYALAFGMAMTWLAVSHVVLFLSVGRRPGCELLWLVSSWVLAAMAPAVVLVSLDVVS